MIIITVVLITIAAYIKVNDVSANTSASTSSKSSTYTVVIDAGHGGYDSGSVAADGTYEKDMTLEYALALGKKLKAAGINVVYTRTSDDVSWTDDNLKDLKARQKIIDKADADLVISLHLNSSESYDDGASGYEIYTDTSSKKSEALSETLLDALDKAGYTQSRGIKDGIDDQLYLIRHASIPTSLVELGFITDSNDYGYLSSETGVSTVTSNLASAIETYLNK